MKFLAGVVVASVLAACADHGARLPRQGGADSADQVMAGFVTTITRNGMRTSNVVSDSAWIYQFRQVVDLKRMTVTMYDSSGAATAVITADKGVYGIREQSLDARGHVVAKTPKGRVLKTEHLIYDDARNEITSDSAFTSTSPDGNMIGTNFTSDPSFRHVVVNKAKGASKGKGFLLPGQPGVKTP